MPTKLICLFTQNKSLRLKLIMETSMFEQRFFLGRILNGFGAIASTEVSLGGNFYDF